MKKDYEDFYEDNEETLHEGYEDMLRHDGDKLNVVVFWWNERMTDLERAQAHIKAKALFEDWVQGQYEDYCSHGQEPEDVPGAER